MATEPREVLQSPLPWLVVTHFLCLDGPAHDVDALPDLLVDELADAGTEATGDQLGCVGYLCQLGKVLEGAVPSFHRAGLSEPMSWVVLGLGFGRQVQELVPGKSSQIL